MTSLTLQTSRPVLNWPALRSHASAAAIAVALHAGLAWVLVGLSDDQPATLEVAQAPTLLKTQLIQLPVPVPVPVVEAPAPVSPPVPVPPEPAPVPEPVVERQAPEQADLAFKRAEQAREEAAQRKRQQEQAEHKRKQQEELAQARERQRQEEQQQAQRREEAQRQEALAAQRAEADRQAAAAANARAQAEAEAASRQYLPIAKEAPAYPQRALDRNIQGECTVSYTVTPSGRVENPQVLDDCHPLFKSPSLAAAKRFRYQPRVVNGQAVAVREVKNTFSYRIEGG